MGQIDVFAVDVDGTLTENGGGRIYLPAIESLRFLENLGHKVVYVTGRSSVEAYILAVFAGTTKLAVGENGGALTLAPLEHILLARKEKCLAGYEVLKKNIEGVKLKPVLSRMTEVVLFRSFDIEEGRKVLHENELELCLHDSKYAFHINEKGIHKGTGLKEALKVLKVDANHCVAIGDSETDIPMFDLCGHSIALDHAPANAKARAEHVVTGRDGVGLIDAIDFIAYNYLGLRSLDDLSNFTK